MMNVESRQKARLWLGVVFVLGAAIGGVFGYNFAVHHVLAGPPAVQQLSEPERRAKRIGEMTRELGLTPEQASTFDGIIKQAHEQMKASHEKSDAEVDAIRQQAREQMRQFLTAEQKPKFEQMVVKMDAERKKPSGGGK